MNRKQFAAKFAGFIKLAVRLNQKAREHGISSLENETEDLDDEDFKMGLRMVVDEVDPKIIGEIFTNKVFYEKNKYSRIYKSIIKRTVLGIQEGLNSRILLFVLFSMTGLTRKEQDIIEMEVFNEDD